ncbi:MAG: aldo/keto reductase [Haloferacaceae archaeon]
MALDMPRLGFGTYQLDERDECVEAVTTALETGYRHVDTAQGYDNEAYVGEAIAESAVDADDLFVATKLRTDNLGYRDAVETARASRDRLGLDSIDLLYVHWPIDTYDPEGTLDALDELVDEGVVDRVGLSNFTPELMDEAMDRLDAPVAAHQVECHPLLPQEELREHAVANDYWLVAYSPVARMEVADVPEIREVAARTDATPAQVSLAWLLSKENVAAIPKASSRAHVAENFAARDLELSDADLARIDAVDRGHRVVDPDVAPWNQ